MKKSPNKNRTLIVLCLLISYVLLQFFWWGYHIISLTQKVNGDETYVTRRLGMIMGEAVVFVTLIGIGAFYVIRSFYKEFSLAKRQKNFSLSVTHELKTPIASSRLFAETLLNRKELSEEKKQSSLEKIIQEQDRLQQLVDKILLASSIGESDQKLSYKPIAIKSFVDNIIDSNSYYNNIENNIIETLVLPIDDFFFTSVIQNLLDNAKKYSSEEDAITIESSIDSSHVSLSFIDKGIGVPEKEKTKIFEQFYRVEDEETRSSKGTGLGLYLVNEIVKMHGAKILCKNNSPKGSIFTIQFKLDNVKKSSITHS